MLLRIPRPGSIYETINKLHVATCGVKEAIERVAESVNWREKRQLKKLEANIARGIGISAAPYLTGFTFHGCNPSAAIVKVCEDGSVNLLTGATDVGQGSDTVLCQIVAEELGIAAEDVDIKRVDTAFTPVDMGAWGSRVTVYAGDATRKAAANAKRQLLDFAAKHWKVNAEDIEIRNGKVFVKPDPEKGMTFSLLAMMATHSATNALAIIGTGYNLQEKEISDFASKGLKTGEGDPGLSYSFTAQEAEVEVDTETGQVRCTDTTIAHDCGIPLNPMAVEGQVEGGAMMGLGEALYEEFIIDKGKTLNPTFLDYKMPRSTDVPSTNVIHIITDDPYGPFGAKECGEGSGVSPRPAVVSAIHDATGIWFKELPVTPERVFKALKLRKA